MQTSGQLNKQIGMEKVASHNPATLEQILHQLELFRKGRLRREATCRETFTIEDILYQVETAWSHRLKIPHALYGSVAVQAQKRNIILHSGYDRATRDTANHREVRSYVWANSDGIKTIAP